MVSRTQPQHLEELTEWCRNKPEDAAVRIASLESRNRRVMAAIKEIRDYGGDTLPSSSGLTVIKMLEDVLQSHGSRR